MQSPLYKKKLKFFSPLPTSIMCEEKNKGKGGHMGMFKSQLTDMIIRFESGEMEDWEVTDFFQLLINTGLAWTLQGYYGRQAEAMIDMGLCTRGQHE
jgi:hypothetical protein